MESIYFKKFELLLKHALEGKVVLNEYNAEKLLHFLKDERETSPGKLLLDTPSFSDCIFNAVANINNLSTSMQIFLIKIATILFKSELLFTKIQIRGFQNSSLKFCVLNNLNSNSPASLHLACIELFTMQIIHRSGVNFLLEHKVWQTILYADVHRTPKPIAVAAYNFIAKLVWKLEEYNLEMELLEVLDHIVGPIVRSEYLDVPVIDTETDKMLADKIFAYLSALLAVVREVDNYAPVNNIMSLMKDYFIMDQKLYEIFEATKNTGLLKLLNTLLFQYFYGILRHLLYNKEIDDFCNKMTAFHRNYIVFAVQKREPFIIIDYVIQSNIMWSRIEKFHANKFSIPLTFERNGKRIEFALQIIVHLMIPIMKKYLMQRDSKMDLIEEFTVKMGKRLTDYIYSCCYTFAGLLEETGMSFNTKVATHSLKELLRLKGHLNQSQAGTIFHCLHYMLDVYIPCNEAGELVLDESPIDPEDLIMLSHLLNALKMLLKEHYISWYENIKVVSIQADLLNLLKQTFLTTKNVVQVLDMLDICMQNFLSPNMSLLVDINSAPSNTLNEIGKVILLYTHHDDWEVRDSAFNLLKNCTEISFIKYIPLQKVIRANNLIIVATKAGLTDPEVYSQCTALRCLAAATKINSIWQEVLIAEANIYFHLVFILKHNAEGMVRTEAANVLTSIYANQKLAPRLQRSLYEVMMSAAIDDLHWEVQLAALVFWKQVIRDHFTHRGMLDGKFPSVTFSKEKRKIIVLDHGEIQRQLIGIMNDLADIGCLTVLLECLNVSHNNIAVMQQAFSIAKELIIEKLDEYKFENVIERVEKKIVVTPSKCTDMDKYTSMDVTNETSEQERNKIIDNILRENQSDLIINLHDNYTKIKVEEMDIDVAFCPRKLVHPNEFLESFRSNDYSLTIENKKKFNADCVNGLDGLLDEMLNLVGID